jgi:hypothetical protein
MLARRVPRNSRKHSKCTFLKTLESISQNISIKFSDALCPSFSTVQTSIMFSLSESTSKFHVPSHGVVNFYSIIFKENTASIFRVTDRGSQLFQHLSSPHSVTLTVNHKMLPECWNKP